MHRKQVQDVETTYNAIIEIARQAGISTVNLEEQKNREINRLNYEYQSSIYQIQAEIGLSWQQQHEQELARLKHLHDEGLIDEKKYQVLRLKEGKKNILKYFQYYSALSSSMVNSIQEAEIASVEAKYAVLIQEAENNGEDTAPGRREGK